MSVNGRLVCPGGVAVRCGAVVLVEQCGAGRTVMRVMMHVIISDGAHMIMHVTISDGAHMITCDGEVG